MMLVKLDTNLKMLQKIRQMSVFFPVLFLSLSGCNKQVHQIPDNKNFLVEITSVKTSYESMDGLMAKNIWMYDTKETFTISKFRIKTITEDNKLIFAELDLKNPAEKDHVYWYPHKVLSQLSGLDIHGLKYK